MRLYRIILLIIPLFINSTDEPIMVYLLSGQYREINDLYDPKLPDNVMVDAVDQGFHAMLSASILPWLSDLQIPAKPSQLRFYHETGQKYRCTIETESMITLKKVKVPVSNYIYGGSPMRGNSNVPNRFCYAIENADSSIKIFPGLLSHECICRIEKMLHNKPCCGLDWTTFLDLCSSRNTAPDIPNSDMDHYWPIRESIKTILDCLRQINGPIVEIQDYLSRNTVLLNKRLIVILGDNNHESTNKGDECNPGSKYSQDALNANLMSINDMPFGLFYLDNIKHLPDVRINDQLLLEFIGQILQYPAKLNMEQIIKILIECVKS